MEAHKVLKEQPYRITERNKSTLAIVQVLLAGSEAAARRDQCSSWDSIRGRTHFQLMIYTP
jgi:hypothetical protein